MANVCAPESAWRWSDGVWVNISELVVFVPWQFCTTTTAITVFAEE